MRDQARSRGKAVLGSPFGPRGRPLHALQPLRTLVHPLFIRFGGSAEQANTPNEECLFEHQNGASRPRERRDDFSRFQAWLKPCLGSLEQGTGLECLWTLWRARIQRPNRFEQIEHRTANRSRVGHEIQNAHSCTCRATLLLTLLSPLPNLKPLTLEQLTIFKTSPLQPSYSTVFTLSPSPNLTSKPVCRVRG